MRGRGAGRADKVDKVDRVVGAVVAMVEVVAARAAAVGPAAVVVGERGRTTVGLHGSVCRLISLSGGLHRHFIQGALP